MWRILLTLLSIATCVAGPGVLAGCSESECKVCPLEPETAGAPSCGQWAGVMYGTLTGQSGTCGDASLLDGDVSVDITLTVDPGEDANSTDDDTTLLTIELTDQEGNWSAFDGEVCYPDKVETPFVYPFRVSLSEFDEESGYQIHNTLSGYFMEADKGAPSQIQATYAVSAVDLNDSTNNCSMQANLTASR